MDRKQDRGLMVYYGAEHGRGVAYGFDLMLEIWTHIPDG